MADDPRSWPHLKAFFPYLELLQTESDRGKVLISCGFLEEQLKQVLLAFMIDDQVADSLLEGANAPLGTFSSRIASTYSLGLISEDEHHDLNHIRRIRNDFAHDISTTFQTQSVVDRCRQLRLKAHDYFSETMGQVTVDPPGQFQTSAVSLIMNLTNRAHYVAQARRSYGNWQR